MRAAGSSLGCHSGVRHSSAPRCCRSFTSCRKASGGVHAECSSPCSIALRCCRRPHAERPREATSPRTGGGALGKPAHLRGCVPFVGSLNPAWGAGRLITSTVWRRQPVAALCSRVGSPRPCTHSSSFDCVLLPRMRMCPRPGPRCLSRARTRHYESDTTLTQIRH